MELINELNELDKDLVDAEYLEIARSYYDNAKIVSTDNTNLIIVWYDKEKDKIEEWSLKRDILLTIDPSRTYTSMDWVLKSPGWITTAPYYTTTISNTATSTGVGYNYI